MQWELFTAATTWQAVANGLWVTVKLLSIVLVVGTAAAVPLALARLSKHAIIRWPAWAYMYFFRGTPLLAQLYLVYFGLGGIFAATPAIRQNELLWPFFRDAWWYVLIAFVLNTAAYVAEILRGAIEAVPHGEREAARAHGMSHSLMMRRIVLPKAFRLMLPAYTNEVILTFKATTIASLLPTIFELRGALGQIATRTYAVIEVYLLMAVLYLILTTIITRLLRLLELRLTPYHRPRVDVDPVPVPATGPH